VCGDKGGNLYFLDLVGLAYAAIVVTAKRSADALTVTCPACQHEQPLSEAQLGGEIACVAQGCALRMKINSFVVNMKALI